MWPQKIKRVLIALLLASLLLPLPSWAAIAYVQSKICTLNNTTSGTVTCAFDNPTSAGNVIVGFVGYCCVGTVTVITFTDNQGGSYATTQSRLSQVLTTAGGAVGVGTVGTPGTTTVTATYTNAGAPEYHGICILEYSGVSTSTPVDVSASNAQGTPTTVTDATTSTAAVTTVNNEMIVGGVWNVTNVTGVYTTGTGFTQRENRNTGNTSLQGACEDVVLVTAGSKAATFTAVDGNADALTFMVALKNYVAPVGIPSGLNLLGVSNGQ